MGMLKEFKEFALKGNLIDMAIGIVIGGAFGGVIKSMVENLITPIIGILTSGVDVKDLKYPLTKVAEGVQEPAVYLPYGAFLQTLIDFLIVAFALFLIVKVINTAKRRFERDQAAAPASVSQDTVLLTQIRDALVKR